MVVVVPLSHAWQEPEQEARWADHDAQRSCCRCDVNVPPCRHSISRFPEDPQVVQSRHRGQRLQGAGDCADKAVGVEPGGQLRDQGPSA